MSSTSFRGRPIHRTIREDSFYQKKKEQNEIAQMTHELLRAFFKSLHDHKECYDIHKSDLENFFRLKDIQDQQELVARILANEMERTKQDLVTKILADEMEKDNVG